MSLQILNDRMLTEFAQLNKLLREALGTNVELSAQAGLLAATAQHNEIMTMLRCINEKLDQQQLREVERNGKLSAVMETLAHLGLEISDIKQAL